MLNFFSGLLFLWHVLCIVEIWVVWHRGSWVRVIQLCKKRYKIEVQPVPSQGHYGFHSFPVVDWFCLFIYLWCITTKHGYQSKRTYGKVVRKQKMDSYMYDSTLEFRRWKCHAQCSALPEADWTGLTIHSCWKITCL
jgi:hypothetical protein